MITAMPKNETDRQYCNSLTEYSRFKTREVMVGNVGVGGDNPIRVQSMTTTDTMDTEATVEQTKKLVDTGCEIVRITAQNKKAAQNLENIKNQLVKEGYDVPLVADIHFTPNAAEIAAEVADKVRVNPGNFVDKKKFDIREYSEEEYQKAMDRIRKKFIPVVEKCKKLGKAMRIGTNHGSLSDRIMSEYGDTPLGMVESALEYVDICEELGFKDIILSMKASNTEVMTQAYRLLVKHMLSADRDYPIHLGVTEAGNGAQGRIKSATGIGALLEDGIGDTIRVSLTEAPEQEVPVVQNLVERYSDRQQTQQPIPPVENIPIDPFHHKERDTLKVHSFGDDFPPQVLIDLSQRSLDDSIFEQLGYKGLNKQNGQTGNIENWKVADTATDYVYMGTQEFPSEPPEILKQIYDADHWQQLDDHDQKFPLFTPGQYLDADAKSKQLNFIKADIHQLDEALLKRLKEDETAVLILTTDNPHGMAEQRRAFFTLLNHEVSTPVVIHRHYSGLDDEKLQLYSATDMGGLLNDGFGDGIWITQDHTAPAQLNELSFDILQATRKRIFRTDYVACPSCGRTLFDLEEVTEKVKSRTDHLKGVKIAVMGCIVNGPGEMADADYGYVGSGPGKITLYRGKEVVKRRVPSEKAVDELIGLIREDGNWREPPEE